MSQQAVKIVLNRPPTVHEKLISFPEIAAMPINNAETTIYYAIFFRHYTDTTPTLDANFLLDAQRFNFEINQLDCQMQLEEAPKQDIRLLSYYDALEKDPNLTGYTNESILNLAYYYASSPFSPAPNEINTGSLLALWERSKQVSLTNEEFKTANAALLVQDDNLIRANYNFLKNSLSLCDDHTILALSYHKAQEGTRLTEDDSAPIFSYLDDLLQWHLIKTKNSENHQISESTDNEKNENKKIVTSYLAKNRSIRPLTNDHMGKILYFFNQLRRAPVLQYFSNDEIVALAYHYALDEKKPSNLIETAIRDKVKISNFISKTHEESYGFYYRILCNMEVFKECDNEIILCFARYFANACEKGAPLKGVSESEIKAIINKNENKTLRIIFKTTKARLQQARRSLGVEPPDLTKKNYNQLKQQCGAYSDELLLMISAHYADKTKNISQTKANEIFGRLNQLKEEKLLCTKDIRKFILQEITPQEKFNFYLSLLLNDPRLVKSFPANTLAAVAYYCAILSPAYGDFNAIEAHQFALEYEASNGLGMTYEELLAAKLWAQDYQHASGVYLPSEIGLSMGLVQFMGYSLKRFAKDLPYAWKRLLRFFQQDKTAEDVAVAHKQQQRSFRFWATLFAFIGGGFLSFSNIIVFTTFVSFVEVLMLGILAGIGITSGALPVLILFAIGGFTLAFVTNFLVNNMLRLSNYVRHKDTNPLLDDLSIVKRETWHNRAKIVGPLVGVGIYVLHAGALGVLLTSSALIVLIPAGYLGYMLVKSIFSDFAAYKDYQPRYSHALLKICAASLALGLGLFSLNPIVLAVLSVAAFASFVKIVMNHYEVLVNAKKTNTSSAQGEGLTATIQRQSEVLQKAKFKLERNNLASALIDWPAKIIAKHCYSIHLAQGSDKIWAGLGLFFLTPSEMVMDLILVPVRVVTRFISFSAKLIQTDSKDTQAAYNRLPENPREFKIFNRLKQHVKNFLTIFDLTQGTTFGKKRSQNYWKRNQANATIENCKTAIALGHDKNIEINFEKPEMELKSDEKVITGAGAKKAIMQVANNQQAWSLMYAHKKQLEIKNQQNTEETADETHKSLSIQNWQDDVEAAISQGKRKLTHGYDNFILGGPQEAQNSAAKESAYQFKSSCY